MIKINVPLPMSLPNPWKGLSLAIAQELNARAFAWLLMRLAWYCVQADLENIRKLLMQRQGAVVNVTADDKGLSIAEPNIRGFLESLPETSASNADWSNNLPLLNEAITVPTQVSIC